MEDNHKINNQSGKVWTGILIVLVGAALLIDNLVPQVPNWLFSWSTFLIALGVFIGLKHKFRNSSGIILILIGTFFTLQDALGDTIDIWRVVWPIMLVVLGLFIIFKPKSTCSNRKRFKKRFRNSNDFQTYPMVEEDNLTSEKKNLNVNETDYLDSVNVFGGSHQTIYAKNFKGGEIVAVFGGCDINLTQADFEGMIELDVTAIFGGAKIIVPAGWRIKHEVTAIFGGFDDKRVALAPEGSNKTLVVKGIALFGGVEIRSY